MIISKIDVIEKEICKLGNSISIDKVPKDERSKEWFRSLIPLINNVLQGNAPTSSAFIRTLFDFSYGG